MHEYDAAFKLTLRDVDVTLRQLTGTAIARWFNVELPQAKNARVAAAKIVTRQAFRAHSPLRQFFSSAGTDLLTA